MNPAPFPWPDDKIARYTAFRAAGPLAIDGRLDEPSWRLAPRSPRFVDLIRGTPTIHDTRAAVLWDDEYLYAAMRAGASGFLDFAHQHLLLLLGHA